MILRLSQYTLSRALRGEPETGIPRVIEEIMKDSVPMDVEKRFEF